MNSVLSFQTLPAPLPAQPERSSLVTTFAWVAMVVSALATPVSFFSLLMILADSHGATEPARAHHVIYFASPQAWLQYPEWARYRRDEIIARIKSEFRMPGYEYDGDGSGAAGGRSS